MNGRGEGPGRRGEDEGRGAPGAGALVGEIGRTLAAETDWLNSAPVFYNVRTGAVSEAIDDVIDLQALEFDPDGLADYLASGYCLFERTPVKDVRFLPPHTRLWRASGGLELERLPDPAPAYLDRAPDEEGIVADVEALVHAWEEGLEGPVVVPTSGGYDSRLLNLAVSDPTRVHAYTYAVSEHPHESYEVKRAQALAERLGTTWEFVELGDYHRYIPQWDRLFGPAVHSHGMYHYEFYTKVQEREGGPGSMLSGVAGDYLAGGRNPAWRDALGDGQEADRRQVPRIAGPQDVTDLLVVEFHRSADPEQALVRGASGAERYFEEHREALQDDRLAALEATRIRMMLLHYLVRVPRALGWDVLPPFVAIDVGGPMLGLPWERRRERRWMLDVFRRRGVDVDDVIPRHGGKGLGVLDYRALRRGPLRPLDAARLAEVIKPDYVAWVNRMVGTRGVPWEVWDRAVHVPVVHRRTWRLRRRMKYPRRAAYYAYLTLKPLENLLRRRDAALKGGVAAAPDPVEALL